MEGHWIVIVAMIMMFQGIIMLQLYQRGWKERQKLKYNYQIKRAKMSTKLKAPALAAPEAPGLLSQAPNLISMLSKLDPDTRQDLIDQFLGGGYAEGAEETEGGGGTMDMIMNFAQKNPEIVTGLLEGLNKNKGLLKSGKEEEAFQ